MADYQVQANGTSVLHRPTGFIFTPADPVMYQPYRIWLLAGNQPDPFRDKNIASLEAMAKIMGFLTNRLNTGMSYTYLSVTNLLQADDQSQGRFTATQTRVTSGLGLPPGFAWRAADNSFFPAFASSADFTTMATAVANWVYANLATSWFHKDSIATLLADVTKTVNDIDAYDFTVGWP